MLTLEAQYRSNLGKVKIGNNVVVMNGSLMMASGGITIDDNTMLAANVQLISNNHDLDNRAVITCLPIHIKKNCWIGAGGNNLKRNHNRRKLGCRSRFSRDKRCA